MSLQWSQVGEVGESYEACVGNVLVGRVTKKTTGIFRSKKTVYFAKLYLFHTDEFCKEFNTSFDTVLEARNHIETKFDNLVNEYKQPRLYEKA